MKAVLVLLFSLVSLYGISQERAVPSAAITIRGEVQQEMIITQEQLYAMPQQSLPDFTITNHLGEPKKTIRQLKGVPVLQVLEKLTFKAGNPKELNQLYLAFVATDGYTVVYSWNELFNTPVGKQVYMITSADGKSLQEMPDRILSISMADAKTGRRHIKGLERIVVGRVRVE
jgi:hypothetical protein